MLPAQSRSLPMAYFHYVENELEVIGCSGTATIMSLFAISFFSTVLFAAGRLRGECTLQSKQAGPGVLETGMGSSVWPCSCFPAWTAWATT